MFLSILFELYSLIFSCLCNNNSCAIPFTKNKSSIFFPSSETITLSLSFEINKTSISNSESKSLSSLKTILENISSLHSIEKLTPPTHCSK